eukprot:CAMPEP_0170146892 /NCGR_PEP_ID=MMETSP0033_2-20121228/32386_1 /TAXON_ID=195969 /ORGANISM="Dolichomastix tenuilepis, Strain CCMP3274" /LENGTH=218 /DNA_ID=CAMNT_0010383657 /DNA_START=102 /DNA_END=755 /DNA_ORIENTATION=-
MWGKEKYTFSGATVAVPAKAMTAAECLDGVAPPTTGTTTLKSCASGTVSPQWAVTDGSYALVTLKTLSLWQKTGEIVSAGGTRLAVQHGGTGLSGLETRVLRSEPTYPGQEAGEAPGIDGALYAFATVSAKTEQFSAEGKYALVTGKGESKVVLQGRRCEGLKQLYLVHDIDNVCVAKVEQKVLWGKELTFEVAAGVDRCAVLALVSALAPDGVAVMA